MTRSEDRRRAVQGAPERRLIISGTREPLSAEDRDAVLDIIAPYAERAAAIGVGDCPTGIDAMAYAACRGLAIVFAADWGRFGKSAGPERNGRMVAWAAEVDHAFAPTSPHRATGLGTLLAFPGPKSRGTWDCVRQARAAGLSVLIKRVGR